MGLRIRTNVQSLTAQRNLGLSVGKASKHMEKMASGYRINAAADDAAGLAISESLKSDIRALKMAQRNARDGVSMLQVAEGALVEVNNMIIRLKELAVQAASDTQGPREREFLNREFMALKNEIDRIAISTEYNGTRLLVGSRELHESLMRKHNKSPLEFQVGKDYLQWQQYVQAH
ncbi:MAG: flagellin, partial [Oligoflexales bacterium]|nr:flagellin [Oligoflexales bacterium]